MVTKNQWIAISGVLVAFSSLNWYVSITQASIDYWIGTYSEQLWAPIGNQSIVVNCKNGGDIDGNFQLIVTFTNATFSTQTSKPYTMDGSEVSFPYTLHKADTGQKVIYYTIDKDAPSFSIQLSVEGKLFSKIQFSLPNNFKV